MAGWPALVKGVDIAAKAILELRNDGYDIKLCIMQSGDFENTRKCITDAIGSSPEWVQILSPREDVATYYNAADIFLSASRTEAFSYCLVEAAYCKPLLITSNVPGPNDLKIDGMERFLSEDVEDLAHKMKELLVISMDVEERKYNVIRLYELRHWAEAIAEMY
jgi:glycosyltransferase involved in cell wall biosynthesis